MKRIAVLGATGSIGASALDVIARHLDRFRVQVLSAHRRIDELVALCRRFQPEWAVITDDNALPALRSALAQAGLKTQPASGTNALVSLAGDSNTDTVIAAIVGSAGLPSTLAAVKAGKRVLLANKEAVVVAGALLMREAQASGAEILPTDSEHNALFQCLPSPGIGAAARRGVRRIILTASGGPFFGWNRDRLASVSPEQACAHPNWSMGQKISVDSATLMNKGLEVIEAHWLFAAPADRIEVLIHRQSIVHSLVEYDDGSLLAQLGQPDMRTALAYGLAWPERIEAGVKPLDLAAIGKLEFSQPDRDTFPCLDLAWQALRAGGSMPAVLNAANEIAVAAFLQRRLSFPAISTVIEATLASYPAPPADTLEHLLAIDKEARIRAAHIMRARNV